MSINELKKHLRREFGEPVWALLIYLLVMNVCVFIALTVEMLLTLLCDAPTFLAYDDTQSSISSNGWGYVAAVIIGAAMLLIWKKKEFCLHTVRQKNRKMQPRSFLMLLCIFLGCQIIFQGISLLFEWLLSFFHLSVLHSMEAASGNMDSFSMLLYAGILAPVSEEILFRGLILRSYEKRGKKFAIFASAFLFGIFHGNLVQSPYAFAAGLVLGYTAVEYSLWWAIALHLANNLGLGYLLPKAMSMLPRVLAELSISALIGICAEIGAILLLVKFKSVKAYILDRKIHPLCMHCFFSSVPVILLCVIMAFSMVLALF